MFTRPSTATKSSSVIDFLVEQATQGFLPWKRGERKGLRHVEREKEAAGLGPVFSKGLVYLKLSPRNQSMPASFVSVFVTVFGN